MSRITWRGEEWLTKVAPAIDRAVTDAAIVAQGQMMRNLSAAGPSAPGEYPAVDTGGLRGSIAVNGPAVTGQPATARVGTNLRRGKLLEFGGIVTAKAAKMLTIPLTRDAKLLRKRHRSLREVPGMRVFRTKTGKVFLGGMEAKSPGVKRTYRALFRLARSVFIAPRPWAMRSVREAAPQMVEAFKTSLRKGLQGVGTVK